MAHVLKFQTGNTPTLAILRLRLADSGANTLEPLAEDVNDDMIDDGCAEVDTIRCTGDDN